MTEPSPYERIVAQQRRIVGVVVLVVLVALALGVVVLVGSIIGRLQKLPTPTSTPTSMGMPDV